MKNNTPLYKLLKWVVASSVSLLAIPISIFIIIFSLYPDLITLNDFDAYKLKSYYNMCDPTVGDSIILKKNPDTLFSKISNKRINKHHLLIIDQTMSTVFDDIELDSLRMHLLSSTSDSDLPPEKEDSVLKSLIYKKIIQSYDFNYNCDKLQVYFYNGYNKETNYDWIFIDNSVYSPDLLKSIPSSINIPDQITDFREIFETIKKKVKELRNLDCITILSDFYHEPKNDLIEEDFIKLKQVTKLIKINLIALWKTTYTSNDSLKCVLRQNNFIKLFNDNFRGVGATEKIFMDNYQNKLYSNTNNFLEINEIISYKPVPPNFYRENRKDTSPKLNFFAPLTSNLKFDEARARLVLDNNQHCFYWKIKSSFDNNETFISYCSNDKETNIYRYRLNQWYEDSCRSLTLSLKLNNNLDFDNLKFCYALKAKSKYKFEECDINIKKVILNYKQKENLKKVLDTLSVLLTICIVCAEIILIQKLLYHVKR